MHRGISRGLVAAALATVAAATGVARADDARVRELERRVQSQDELIRRLLEKVESLEQRLDGEQQPTSVPARTHERPPSPSSGKGYGPAPVPGAPSRVDLEASELPALPSAAQASTPAPATETLARPWYQNIDLFGFVAGGLVWTGEGGTDEKASFLNYQGNLELRAQAWEDVFVHSELAISQIGFEDELNVRVGELYIHLADVGATFLSRPGSIGVKLGRFDVPFGEDYLTRDVLDNPLITWSAAIPYAVDEGILVHGQIRGLFWIASAMNGSLGRAGDDDAEKFFSLKLYGNLAEALYVSASAYWNGDTSAAAMGLGGSYWMPIGSWDYFSSAGASSSDKVDAYSYELDLRYDLPSASHVKAQFGQVFVDDDDDDFSRTIYYGQVEPLWNLGATFDGRVYLAARASIVGTFDGDEGYVFEGRPFADGSDSFGYDTESMWRIALGLGYRPNDRMLLKLEWSRDRFDLIDGSALRGRDQSRHLVGGLLAVGF
ncbi:MAG TPA: hypothetical protein VEL28_14160 [Candidatus Binatia bacterium]|nr:hypothetical protein [Candidatus Binatia bacterium]